MKADAAVTPERFEARACARPYIALGIIFGFLFAFGIWQATVPGGDWRITGITGATLFLTMLWLATLRIQYSEGQLSYRSLFVGTRSISISDIESAETRVVSSAKGSRRLLFIYAHPERAQRPIRINVVLFSKEDMGQLFDLLGPKFKGPRTIGVYTDETA
jgi:hypothetical protein